MTLTITNDLFYLEKWRGEAAERGLIPLPHHNTKIINAGKH